MLPAAARVRHRTEYAATLKRGRRAKRGAVVVHLAERETPIGQARAGFIVSRAVGDAVARNKVKRRLRHIAAHRISDWPANVDIVVRALPAAANAGFWQLAADVDAAVEAIRSRS